MSERDQFLQWARTILREAEIALHDGNAGPRLAIWSAVDPVSVFGAWKSAIGQEEVQALFRHLETRFSDCRSHEYEILAADVIGDVAYTVGYEHTQASVGGEARTYSLRVTQIYRREEGEWKVAHRHADEAPPEAS